MKNLVRLILLCFLTFPCFAESLILQTSGKASLTKLHTNNYILTLFNPTPYVNIFISNQKNKAGIIGLNKFLSLWKRTAGNKNFYDHPPNAAIALLTDQNEYQNADVIVTNPSFNNGSISYQIKTLNTPLYLGNLQHIVIIFDNIPFIP